MRIAIAGLLALFFAACAFLYTADNPPAEVMVKVANYSRCEGTLVALRPDGIRAVAIPFRRATVDEPDLNARFTRHSVFGSGEIRWQIYADCGGFPLTLEANVRSKLPNTPLNVYVDVKPDLEQSTVVIRRRT